MKHRSDDEHELVDRRLEQLADDDALLNALGQGIDPTDGRDPLAGLLLQLKRDIDAAPMPQAPVIQGSSAAPTTQFPAVTPPQGTGHAAPTAATAATTVEQGADAPTGGAEVIDLSSRRRRRGGGAIMHGLIGAAAATLLIAGGGVAVHNATPGSALWGANTAIFGDHAAVVELATTLEEADSRTNQGDIEGALKLLDKAKAMANEIGNTQRAQAPKDSKAPVTQTQTATTTATVTTTVTTAPADAPDKDTRPESPTPTPTPTPVPTVTVTAPVAPPQQIDPELPAPRSSTPETRPVEIPDFMDPPQPVQPDPVAQVDPLPNPGAVSNADASVPSIDD